MSESKKIHVRLKPEYQERLGTAIKMMGVDNISEGVRRLIDIALSFYADRQSKIELIKQQINELKIKPDELGIIEKRKYLGR